MSVVRISFILIGLLDFKYIFIIGWAITPYLALERNAQYSEEVVREITDPSLQHHNHHHHDGHHQNGHHSGHHQHGHSHGSHEYGHQNGPEHTRTVKLVDLLLERARAGVAVRVLVWNETNWGFMLDSHKTKHVLEGVQYVPSLSLTFIVFIVNFFFSSPLFFV